MTGTLAFDVILVFLGLFLLMAGFINREKKAGPFVLWVGVMCMISVFAYHIYDRLK